MSEKLCHIKVHAYLGRKSGAYHRLNNEFVPISYYKHKSATKQRLNFNKKIINLNIIALQNNRVCFCFLYKEEPQSTKNLLPVFILMNMV